MSSIASRCWNAEWPNLHAAMAGQSGRIDQVENRLERIEKRLDLTDA